METIHLIRVSTLKERPNHVQQKIPTELLDIKPYHGCEISILGDSTIDFELFKRHSEVYVSGRVGFRAHLICADCATDFERDFSEPVSMVYQKGLPPFDPGQIHELGEEELALNFYEGDELDLLPLIRDTILLAVPIAPLCRPDCKGICPDCGANLNTEQCNCCGSAVSAIK